MRTVSVFSSQANLPFSDINRQDNKTLRAQFRIIFSNQRLISCQFAFTLPRMWRFYHHAVKESQAGTTGALISYTYCLHEMVCTYMDPAKMVEHFYKGHLENPPPKNSKMNLHWFLVLEVIQKEKKSPPWMAHLQLCYTLLLCRLIRLHLLWVDKWKEFHPDYLTCM